MLTTKSKLLTIIIFILLTTPSVSSVNACEPPGPGISWYLSHLEIDSVTLLDGIEINSRSTTSEEREQNSLSLTNSSEQAVYILHNAQKESDLRELYQANQENPGWVEQIEVINDNAETRTTIIKIEPNQTQLIYQGNPVKFDESFAKWPMDYGGHRPDDVTLPDPINHNIILAHQDGILMIPITESVLLNPSYPAQTIWDGCDEIYDSVPVLIEPTVAPTENTAVSNIQTNSSSPIWVIVGITFLAIVAAAIYKWQ